MAINWNKKNFNVNLGVLLVGVLALGATCAGVWVAYKSYYDPQAAQPSQRNELHNSPNSPTFQGNFNGSITINPGPTPASPPAAPPASTPTPAPPTVSPTPVRSLTRLPPAPAEDENGEQSRQDGRKSGPTAPSDLCAEANYDGSLLIGQQYRNADASFFIRLSTVSGDIEGGLDTAGLDIMMPGDEGLRRVSLRGPLPKPYVESETKEGCLYTLSVKDVLNTEVTFSFRGRGKSLRKASVMTGSDRTR